MTRSQPPSHSFRPKCGVCSMPTATIELTEQHGRWHLKYSGLGGENGEGDPISAERAEAVIAAFAPPYEIEIIRVADFYDDAGYCLACEKFYCATHWNITSTGGGWCPEGHFKSLDPHWSPD